MASPASAISGYAGTTLSPQARRLRAWLRSLPLRQILAIFDKVLAQFETGESRGCPESFTLAEFPDPDLPAHRNAVAGKVWIRQHLGGLAGQFGAGNPAELADRLMLVLEGLLAAGSSRPPGQEPFAIR